MAFVTSLDASAELSRRGAERRLVNTVFAAWSGRGAPFTVIVHNISETGFRAEFASELHVGDEVRLRLGKAGYVSAEVVWRDGWDHGCRFIDPITPEEVREATESLTRVMTDADEAAPAPLPTEPESWMGKKPKRRKKLWVLALAVAAVVIGEGYVLARVLF